MENKALQKAAMKRPLHRSFFACKVKTANNNSISSFYREYEMMYDYVNDKLIINNN